MLDEKIKNYLTELGFNSKQISTIVNTKPLSELTKENMFFHIASVSVCLIELGYSKKDIVKMVIKTPNLFSHSTAILKEKFEYLLSLGYSVEQIKKLTKNQPAMYNYNIKNINEKIDNMTNLGYSHEEVLKMGLSFSGIYSLSTNAIKNRINNFLSMGYTM